MKHFEEKPKHLAAKELLDGLDLRPGCNPEHVPYVESSAFEQDVTVGVELEQAPKSLHRDERAGLELCTRQDSLKVLLEGLSGAPAEFAKELSVVRRRGGGSGAFFSRTPPTTRPPPRAPCR